ncbi:MAG: fumarylacetoacetate hydrolase family protein [Tabrizicola sp.]|uniref:fumarylacetoacetate hydrolase family protein n=1 Tax=Tabrizicola sp. TaxID=2005166 RepID=UPI0027364F11|nr:fumarylacetoacetate hydrolase family protein [Tabrizicola sp.]MDP3263441.1 fumarylacetoacetate hydrolase family protein [Tabrizicola sp.]MDP3646798.1 fumarylacetoacetate hydrolase family protein [Paracoccaceae bacterium]
MTWARIKAADGQILGGIVADQRLSPMAGIGGGPAGPAVSMQGATLLAPCVPGKFIGLWNNYHAAAARNGWAAPTHPLHFLKPVTCVVGDGADVVLPQAAGRVVFEGELGIVIGTRCHTATEAEAEAAIFGYTCVNDLTSVDILNADPAFAQWTRAKGFDGFGVIGPVVVPGLDWRDLTIRTLVNGRERQSYPASDMIFSPPQIVRHLSRDMTLMPGDVIAVGTSLGTRPVKPADQVTVSIEGIGSVTVTMLADPNAVSGA